MKKSYANEIKLGLFTLLLGAASGAVIWLFLKALGLCTELIWEIIPARMGFRYTPVVLCAAGGLAAGLLHRKYGDLPEELPVVLGRIKRDRHYSYDRMGVLLISAFIPLAFGASVGPEAGLTGIIAGLCYWVGDNVKYAKEQSEHFPDIGAAVTLGSLFHVPLFGIFAVEEDEEGTSPVNISIPKTSKLVLYGLSICGAFLATKLLSSLFGAAGEGFPSYAYTEAEASDFALMLIYIPLGILLYLWFEYSEKLMRRLSDHIPVIAREIICGACIGMMSLLVPVVLFSGEEQMAGLAENFTMYAPAVLMGICLLKLLMTAFCISFGLKGGHFFPLIYGCSCMGFGIAAIINGSFAGAGDPAVTAGHAVFAAAVITASTLGAQMKKPIAVTLLLLICFPLRHALWIFLAAALASRLSGIRKQKD